MKLSEAIREGAKKRPQGHGYYYTKLEISQSIRSCALGAAEEALKGGIPDIQCSTITSDFPILTAFVLPACPACTNVEPYQANLFGMIPHLNDDHHWSREQIADWVATLEQPAP